MMKVLVLFTLVAGLTAGPVYSQTTEQAKPEPASKPVSQAPRWPVTGLKVDVTLSRYQGEKRLTNLPYSLSVNSDGRPTQLRMNAEIPIAAGAFIATDGKSAPQSYSYRSFGTSIDCTATPGEDGSFRLQLTVEDSSVYDDSGPAQSATLKSDRPAFRSFRSASSLVLRDGQSTEFTMATDRVSGETVRVTVKLTLAK